MAVSVFPAPTIDTSAPPGAIEKISTYALNGTEAFMDIAVPSAGRYAVRYTGPERQVGVSLGWEPRKATSGLVNQGEWVYIDATEADLRLKVGAPFHTSAVEPRVSSTTPYFSVYADASYRGVTSISNLSAVVFFPAANLYIVGNSSGQLATSPDGFTWTTRTNTTSQMVRGFTYSANRVVAYHAGGAISYSSNGTSWTAASSPTNNSFNDGIYINGQFLLVGDNGASVRSTDGITWTANPTASGNYQMVSVAVFRGKYCIAAPINAEDGARVYVTDNPSVGYAIGNTPRYSAGNDSVMNVLGIVSTFNGFVASSSMGNSFKSPSGFDWTGTRLDGQRILFPSVIFGQVVHKISNASTMYIEGVNGRDSFSVIQTMKANGFDWTRNCDIAEGPMSQVGRTLFMSAGNNIVDVYYRKHITGIVEVYRTV
jgi:hypothetical protein